MNAERLPATGTYRATAFADAKPELAARGATQERLRRCQVRRARIHWPCAIRPRLPRTSRYLPSCFSDRRTENWPLTNGEERCTVSPHRSVDEFLICPIQNCAQRGLLC